MILILILVVLAVTSPLTLHEKREFLPHGVVKGKRVEANAILPIRIALAQSNLENGEDFLMDISDPESPNYGKHWTIEQIHATFRPSASTVKAVKGWLINFGIDEEHVRIAADGYHLPSDLVEHIDYIIPGVSFSGPLAKIKPRQDSALYSIPDPNHVYAGNAIGVFEQAGNEYDQLDLNLFFTNCVPQIPNGTHPELISINGGVAPTRPADAGLESISDLELLYSLVYPQSVTLYQTVQTSHEAYVGESAFLNAIDGAFCTKQDIATGADCGTANLTRVLSASAARLELAESEAVTKRTCFDFLKLGLKGHTIVYASNDYGVAGTPPSAPTAPDPFNAPLTNGCWNQKRGGNPNVNGTVFNPAFPASCPYVTSVGGTQLNSQETVKDAESAMFVHNLSHTPVYYFSSGGGFSNYFSPATYQQDTLRKYFATHGTTHPTYEYNGNKSIGANGGFYNRHGRGFPDVSANGAGLGIYLGGQISSVSGTSLLTPIFASIINLINDERTHAGKPPVGFINPVLYSHPEVFNDITKGHNPGCGTSGFRAVQGWDPVSGLGTPKYPELLKVFMALP